MSGFMPGITRITDATSGIPQPSHPKPERLVLGNPLRNTWNALDAPVNAAQNLSTGVWHCEPGMWRIEFGPNQQEVFTVLTGRCRLHDAQDQYTEAGPGQALHIPAGFVGAFEVLEAMSKVYVILE
jgi:uncharacterized cupin superfamily protein